MTFEARAYQAEAVQNLRSGLAEGFLRQMLSSPTGSGKTEIGMILVRGGGCEGETGRVSLQSDQPGWADIGKIPARGDFAWGNSGQQHDSHIRKSAGRVDSNSCPTRLARG